MTNINLLVQSFYTTTKTHNNPTTFSPIFQLKQHASTHQVHSPFPRLKQTQEREPANNTIRNINNQKVHNTTLRKGLTKLGPEECRRLRPRFRTIGAPTSLPIKKHIRQNVRRFAPAADRTCMLSLYCVTGGANAGGIGSIKTWFLGLILFFFLLQMEDLKLRGLCFWQMRINSA